VFWRLSLGPIGLDFMRDELQDALASALDGDVVGIGEVQASWLANDRSLGIVLTDVKVDTKAGVALARTPRLSADLSFSALLRGKLAFSRLVVEGGEVSIVRDNEGRISAGLGAPNQLAAHAIEARKDAPKDAPAASADDASGPQSLAVLRDAVASQAGMARDLRELRFEGATLYLRDAVTGVDWTSDNAVLRVGRDAGAVRAEARGALKDGTTLRITARAAPGLRQAQFGLELGNAVPARLFPHDGPLARLARVELPVSASASAVVDESRGLLAADMSLTLGAGHLQAQGRDINVRSASAHLTFDPAQDLLTLVDAAVNTNVASGKLSGRVRGLAATLTQSGAPPMAVTFTAERLHADLRPIFAGPLDVGAITASGTVDPAQLRVGLDSLRIQVRGIDAKFSGEARLERVSDGRLLPSIKLSGPIAGSASTRDVLDFWPVEAADGTRDWLDEHLQAGRLFDVHLDLDMPAQSIVDDMLPNDKLTLTFRFDNARTTILETMSPLTQARGSAVLRGNSFHLTLETGEMAGLAFESGYVEMPRLSPKGALAYYGGVVHGEASQVLALLDEPPLGFPSSYGVRPTSIGGSARVEFVITRPMLVDVPAEDLGFNVKSELVGVSAPSMLPSMGLSDAAMTITANPKGLQAKALGRLGPAPASIEWTEQFGRTDGSSTHFHVEAGLDAAAFDALGAPVRPVFTGSAQLTVDAEGRGLDIASAKLRADLTDAALTLPGAGWSKPAGAAGSAQVDFKKRSDGGFTLSGARLTAPGADAAGSVALAGSGRLDRLDIDRLKIEGFMDAQAHITRGQDGGIVATISGASADVSAVARGLAQDRTGSGNGRPEGKISSRPGRGGAQSGGWWNGVGAPLDLDVRLGRLVVADGESLQDVRLRLDHDGRRIRRMSFAATDRAGMLSASVEPGAGARRLTLEIPDAGKVLHALFGATSLRGGLLHASAALPPLDAPDGAPTSGDVQLTDFTIVDVPPLARILSIGSFQGLANTLSGEGIRFNRLDAPFEVTGGRIKIKEARAAGHALGVTVGGVVDLGARTLDLEGALAPAYEVNKALGKVPVFGDLLMSRADRGEGKALFGLTYRVEGPFEQTRVFVNPLSAFTPGRFRRMFEPLTGDAGRKG
jgi:hypothetical protein